MTRRKDMTYLWLLFVVLTNLLHFNAVSGNGEKEMWDIITAKIGDGKFIPSPLNKTISVQVTPMLVTMSDYDQKKGTMRLGFMNLMRWKIPNLDWIMWRHLTRFGGLRIPSKDIWVPDIIPRRDSEFYFVTDYRVLVFTTGEFIWIPYIMASILCKDIRNGPRFPNDHKKCRLTLASQAYSSHDLYIKSLNSHSHNKLTNSLNSQALLSSGWKFVNASVKKELKSNSIQVDIIIRRNDVYFGLAVVAPGVVTGLLLSFLYLVPPCSPSRIVAQSVCLLIIIFVAIKDLRRMGSSVEKAPAADYFVVAMILNLVALFWSILASVVWAQAPPRSPGDRGRLDAVLDKLQCISALPRIGVEDAEIEALSPLEEEEVTPPKRSTPRLSSPQRLCLVLDQLLSLANFITFIVLFHHFGL